MMVLDHVGDQEAIVYAQLGQQDSNLLCAPLRRHSNRDRGKTGDALLFERAAS